MQFSLALKRTMYNFKISFFPNFILIQWAKYICPRDLFSPYHFKSKIHGVYYQLHNTLISLKVSGRIFPTVCFKTLRKRWKCMCATNCNLSPVLIFFPCKRSSLDVRTSFLQACVLVSGPTVDLFIYLPRDFSSFQDA